MPRVPVVYKDPNESFDWKYDLSNQPLFVAGEAVNSAVLIFPGGAPTLALDVAKLTSGYEIGTNYVSFWLYSGTDGVDYPMTLRVTTQGSRVIDYPFVVKVRENAAVLRG